MEIADIPSAEETGATAKTTMTSFRVIEALKTDATKSVSELADELDLAKGTVHKHLTTLRRLNYVVKDGREYRLSVSFLGLGTTARSRLPIYDAAQEPLENLAEVTGEVAGLMVAEHGYGIYILRTSTTDDSSTDALVGERLPLHATAGGKAILSYTPAAERKRIFEHRGLPALTQNTITEREALEEDLQRARNRRVAYDRGEYQADRHCIAGPIVDQNERAVAAVTISGSATDIAEKDTSTDFGTILGSTISSLQSRLDSELSSTN